MRERESETLFFNPTEVLWEGVQKLGGPVNAHTHLDRAQTITPLNFSKVNAHLHEKWAIVDNVKENSSVDQIYDRMVATVERLRLEGTRTIGSFIDVDPVIGLKAVRAAEKLRQTFKDEVDFVFANQTLKGVLDPDARKWFLEGACFADIVGGLPGKDHPNEERHIEIVLQTAKDMGKMAHVHVDQLDSIKEKETELLAEKTVEADMQGRVVAVHSISLAAHERPYREAVYWKMRQAGLMVISCPNAWINSRRSESLSVTHNSITPVDELKKYEIITAIGSDNILDVYMPYNEGFMKDELRLLCEGCHIYDTDYLAIAATLNGRIVLGLDSSNGT